MGARPARLSEDNRDVDKAACNYSLFMWEILYHKGNENTREKVGDSEKKQEAKLDRISKILEESIPSMVCSVSVMPTLTIALAISVVLSVVEATA